MDNIDETTDSRLKTFVRKHKTKLAVAATAVTCLALNRAALKQHNDFLKEKDLYDEFYELNDEE